MLSSNIENWIRGWFPRSHQCLAKKENIACISEPKCQVNTKKKADWVVVWYFTIVFPYCFELTSIEVLEFLCILVYNFPVSWLLTVFLFIATKSVVSCSWIKSQDLPLLMDPEGKCWNWGAYKVPVKKIRMGLWRGPVFKMQVIVNVHWNDMINEVIIYIIYIQLLYIYFIYRPSL